MGMESNQPVEVEGVTQEEKTNATIVQALVLAAGVLGLIPGINFLGSMAGIAVIVLYFVWKDKGPFVSHHLRQAFGLALISIGIWAVVFIISLILGGVVAAATLSGGFGSAVALMGVVTLLGTIGLIVNIGIGVLGLLGLLAAQKGEAYTYPVVGKFIANYGKK